MDELNEVCTYTEEEFLEFLQLMVPEEVPIIVETMDFDLFLEMARDRFFVDIDTYQFTANSMTEWINERVYECVGSALDEMVQNGTMEITGLDENGEFIYAPKE